MALARSSLTAAYVVASAVTVVGAATHRRRWQYAAKPLLMPILLVRARAWTSPAVATGLVAATVGDLAMIEPDDDRRFTVGASSFAVMQGCWSILLLRSGSRVRARHALPRAAGWVAGLVVAHAKAPRVARISGTYGVALGVMSTLGADGDAAGVGVGSTLFTLSDATVLARRTMNGDNHRRVAEVVVLLTYCAAQFLLVESLTSEQSAARLQVQ